MEIKFRKKIKSAVRKEAMKQDQRDLSNLSDASKNDERELELTPKPTPSTTLYYLSEEGTNTDFEVTKRSTASSDKTTATVHPT